MDGGSRRPFRAKAPATVSQIQRMLEENQPGRLCRRAARPFVITIPAGS